MHQIEALFNKFELNQKIEKIGIRVKEGEEIEDFDELGDQLLNLGLIDSIEQVKKNTKKTCIIQMDNDLDFNISFKKEGSFYIYIITPIIGN